MLRHRWSCALGAAALVLGLSVVAPPAAQAVSEGETDAGSTIATARVISGVETTITGTLAASTDLADVYAITVPDPARLWASTFGSEMRDLSLSLFDADGHLIAYNNRWYGGWPTTLWGTLPPGWAGNPFVPPAAGTYYLGVSSGSPTDDSGGALPGGTAWVDPTTNSPVEGPFRSTDTLGGWSGSGSGSYMLSLSGVGSPATAPPTLFAVGFPTTASEGASAPSSLYTVDPADGQLTLVGAIELDGVPLTGLGGIDMGLDGKLYAVDNAHQRLLTLATTAVSGVVAATVVGPFGSYAGRVTDLAFDAHGYLYGLVPRTPAPDFNEVNALVRVKDDGTLLLIREELDLSSGANGLAWSPAGEMVAKADDEMKGISQQTGALDEQLELSQGTNNALEFSPAGTVYTVVRPADWSDPGTGSTLAWVNPASGFVSLLGNEPEVKVSGLAFDTGTGSPPGPARELVVGLSADDVDLDVALGQDVVFTVTVQNTSATGATGVTATYAVPSGFSYTSHDGGTYDPGTGLWTIGALASGATASVQVTATAVTPGTWTYHEASATAAEYVPGPAVALLEAYVLPVAPGQPSITSTLAGDGRVLVTFAGPTSNGGSSIQSYNLYVCSGAACSVDVTGAPVSVSESPYLLTVPNGSTYGLALTAVNHVGEGIPSATAYVTPHAPTILINRAWPSKGKVYVDYTADIAPLELLTGYGPVTYQVTGSKGAWTACVMDGAYCTVKSSAKTVQMRVSDNGGTSWATSDVAQVSRR